jgi:hypothetical protein
VSELPNERTGAQAEPAKEDAWASVHEAQALWAGAMRAQEQAPRSRVPRSVAGAVGGGGGDARRSRARA